MAGGEAVPQLAYLAYEMARRGVQRLGEEEVLGLLERIRQDYPSIRALRRRTPEEFLALLEARSSILIASGGSWRDDRSRAEPVWEFRHLTLQEYLAAQALLKGRYPDRNRQRSLAEEIAPLAGTLKQEDAPSSELEVSDSWQETLRLLVADAGDDDVDEVLLAILRPIEGEDPARTARPRAVLAARCLADEPNVLEETAREVLAAFAAQVSERDADGPDASTSLDRAAVEVGRSIWIDFLKHYLLREFLERTTSDFSHCGALWSMVARTLVPTDPAQRSIWLSERVEELRSPDDMVAAGMALIVMDIAYSGLAVEAVGLVEALLSLLQRREPIQMAAVWALAWLSDQSNPRITKDAYVWEAVDDECRILISTLQSRKPIQPEARCCFIAAISNSKLPRVVDSLLPYLDDDDVSVRRVTVRGLGTIGDTQATESLLTLLNDEDISIRRAVIDVLGQLRDGRAVEPLAALLADADADIRRTAIGALGQIGDGRAVEPLAALLADADAGIRWAAIGALGQIGDGQAVEPLAVLLTDADAGIRRAAIGALGQIGDGRAVEPLGERLGDADSSTRLIIAAALARCGDQRDVQLLITAFVALDEEDRRAAIRASAAVRDQVTQRLLSRDLDAFNPWIDPHEPITIQRVEQAARRLQMSADEVRARYEALANELPLRLEWRAG